jgi:hypothetical protein
MIDRLKGRIDVIDGWGHPSLMTGRNDRGRPIVMPLTSKGSFTRSNGTMLARIYERLTKASRRRYDGGNVWHEEQAYRQGVYDGFKALQKELS